MKAQFPNAASYSSGPLLQPWLCPFSNAALLVTPSRDLPIWLSTAASLVCGLGEVSKKRPAHWVLRPRWLEQRQQCLAMVATEEGHAAQKQPFFATRLDQAISYEMNPVCSRVGEQRAVEHLEMALKRNCP